MPDVSYPISDSFWQLLNQLQQRITNLEMQQQFGIQDPNYNTRLWVGNQSTVAGQVVPPSTAGAMPGTTWSIAAFDTSGKVRAQFGQLPNGDYGIEVTDALGHTAEVQPFVAGQQGANQTTTSTSYTDLATAGPSVTVSIGANGSALIIGSAFCDAAPSDRAMVALYLDGTIIPDTNYQPFMEFANGGSGNSGGTMSQIYYMTGLSVGSHTFSFKYKSQNGGTANFATRDLLVQPQ